MMARASRISELADELLASFELAVELHAYQVNNQANTNDRAAPRPQKAGCAGFKGTTRTI